jgi:membrane-bound lytic murein transglycosylase B
VARFLNAHGWQAGQPVAVPAVAAGVKPSLPLREMRERGVLPIVDAEDFANLPVTLIDLVSSDQPTEYWIGFDNFYVITRYNHSSFYAMSVFLLAESLREALDTVNR